MLGYMPNLYGRVGMTDEELQQAGAPAAGGWMPSTADAQIPTYGRAESAAKPAETATSKSIDTLRGATDIVSQYGSGGAAGKTAKAIGSIAMLLSDDRTKLAQAWDEGAQAGIRYGAFQATKQGDKEQKKLAERSGESMTAKSGGNVAARSKIESGLSKALINRSLIPAPKTYDTPLSPDEEEKFRAWKKKHAPEDSGDDYDLRGAFKAGVTPDPKTGHWPDTFKKPNHPTFSVESQYAKDAPERAGRWEGEKFIPPQALAPSRSPISNANRAQESQPYTYKPEFTPNGQTPGEMNVGPTAQNMAKDPVAGTAVKVDPATGLAGIDPAKLARVQSAGIADLQKQQDETRSVMGSLASMFANMRRSARR